MKEMPIIDGHIDLAWNAINLCRRFTDSVIEKHLKDSTTISDNEGKATIGYPEIQSANIRIVLATIWVETDNSLFPSLGKKYHSLAEAEEYALEQYDYYKSLCAEHNYSFITTVDELNSVLFSSDYRFGIIPIIEGADFINSEHDLSMWLDKGIRIIGPIWQKNHIGGCSEFGDGLSAFGKRIMRSMSNNGVIVDIAHMSDCSISDTFATFDGIIIDSHTTCRKYVNEERLISDDQIVEIGHRNGIIGLMTWDKKIKNSPMASIYDFIDHIDHISDIIGNVDCVGIGSSMDGGYGVDSLPAGMSDISSLTLLKDALLKRGYTYTEIEKILYRNWHRVLSNALIKAQV